jgi:pSer/pThr/pTyr-binding forkhead associated (FHA) protein
MITVPRDAEVVIGRSSRRSNFVINGNGNVSRAHCKIFYDKREGCLKIEDCNSSHGTYVNGVAVRRGGMYLEVGDTISLAGEKFLVSK